MFDANDAISYQKERSEAVLQAVALAAATSEFDNKLFRVIVGVAGKDISVDSLTDTYDAVVNSRFVERTLTGKWRVRPQYRQPLSTYLKETSNGHFAAIHQALAHNYEQGGGLPPSNESVAQRLAYSQWLYHHACSSANGRDILLTTFEKAYDSHWVGDSRAVIKIADETRPQLVDSDPEFKAMQGLQHYREGHREQAVAILRRIWQNKQYPRTRIIAIGLHIFGDKSETLPALNESLEILREIKDKGGIAQVLHTRGKLGGEKGWLQKDEVLKDLNESLKIEREIKDKGGIAKVLHTRGKLGGEKGWLQKDEVLKDLNESLEILREIKDKGGIAQVLHTRGKLGGEKGWLQKDEVLKDLNGSLEIGREIGIKSHIAQVLHTRGKLGGEKRWLQKEKVLTDLQESIDQDPSKYHVAQVLHTRGKLGGEKGWLQKDEVLKDLNESLEIGREIGIKSHIAQVLHTRGKLGGEKRWLQKDEVLKDLNESLAIERELNRKSGIAQVLNSKGNISIKFWNRKRQNEEYVDENEVIELIRELMQNLHLDPRLKNKGITYNLLAQSYSIINNRTMEAASLELMRETNIQIGNSSFVDLAENRLKPLNLSQEELNVAKNQLLLELKKK